MNTIAVIDYGMGNLHSVEKAIEHVGDNVKVLVTNKPGDVADADRVVFPGVGAIKDCISEMKNLGLDDAVKKAVLEKPVLAVCVGMQAVMEFSEENEGVDCLGILPGKVQFFGEDLHDSRTGERLKIPHMGWNEVHQACDHHLWHGIQQDSRFYFVHSYCVQTTHKEIVAGECEYGVRFAAAVMHENLFAVQFHPEKSQHAGLALLKNFTNWSVS